MVGSGFFISRYPDTPTDLRLHDGDALKIGHRVLSVVLAESTEVRSQFRFGLIFFKFKTLLI